MNIKNNIEITPRVHQADVVLSNQNPNNINASHPQQSTLYPSNVTTNRKTKDTVFDKANEKDNPQNNKIEKLEDNKVSSKKNTSSPTYNPTNKMEYNPEDNMKTYNPTPNYDPEVKLKAKSHRIDKIISSKE